MSRSVNVFTAKQRELEGYESFRAIARVQRSSVKGRVQPRVVRTLMDPGAELNLVRSAVISAQSQEKKSSYTREKRATLFL